MAISAESLFIGDQPVDAVYLGADLVWSSSPAPEFPERAPSVAADRIINSGHSLTTAYVQSGLWPGNMRRLALANNLISSEDRIINSDIPGSTIAYRWDNRITIDIPGMKADARHDIADFNSLVITEGGPPPHPDADAPGMANTLDFLCRFAANQIENGAGEDLVLWSIWPWLEGADAPGSAPPGWSGVSFANALPLYTRSFKHMRDYVEWKMRQVYGYGDEYRVWLIPGSEWMARVYADVQNGLVPGISEMTELFSDTDPVGETIHTNEIAGYGLAMLVLSCLYGRDWSAGDTYPAEDGVTPQLVEYFRNVANDISNSYGPAGRAGANGWELEFDGDSDVDPLPNWSFDPEPGPGGLPETLISWDADSYTGPTLTGAPASVDGELVFDGSAVSCPAELTGFYVAMRFRMTGGDRYASLVTASNSVGGAWPSPSITINMMGTAENASIGIQGRNPGWDDDQGGVTTGNYDRTEYHVMEFWAFPNNTGCTMDGNLRASSDTADIPNTTHLDFFRSWSGPEVSETDHYIISKMHIMDRMPTETERQALTNDVSA